MNASKSAEPTSETELSATQGKLEQSCETTLSMEHLESIALEALAASPAALSRPNQGRGENDLQAVLGKHPNIAALLDAGTTETSQPYSVVTDVDGQRIDDYCDSQRLTIPARLQLFAQVCRAVHFAHQHAVIHGGLKPSNILVAADGVPKLMNFASTRLAHPETAGGNDSTGTVAVGPKTLTQTSELMLTPEYASPEQLKGETITTASDIYALGVVLYQLLTGRSPYRLKTATRSDVFQAVFEQAPEKPSSAVTRRAAGPVDSPTGKKPALAETLPPAQPCEPNPLSTFTRPISTLEDIALARGCSPQRLKRTLSGDLDAIVLTALRKEPERRYASAERFADDLDHYLQGMRVRAHDDSTVYRCGKFVRRHTALVTIGLLLVVALLTVVTGMTTELMLARRHRDRVDRSFNQTRGIIDQIFSRISNERLLNQPGLYPLRVALLQDAQRFYKDFLDQHSSDVTLRPELIEASGRLAKITSLIGPASEAVSQYRQTVALWEKLLREEPTNRHYQEKLAATLSDLGVVLMSVREPLDEAVRTFRRAQELIEPLVVAEPQSVPKRQELGLILLNVAQIQWWQDQPEEALDSLDRVLEIELQLAAEDPRSLEPRISLATAYATAGRILAAPTGEVHRALASYHQAIEIHETIAQEHPELADQSYQFARDLSELSELQQRAGQLDLAFQNLHRSLSIFEHLDQSYPGILIYQRGLGSVYNMMSDLQRQRAEAADSLALAQKARTLFERLVSEHPQDSDFRIDLARSYNNLGRQFQQTGEFAEALRSFQRAMDLYESLPDLDPQTAYKLACNVSRCIPLLGTKNQSTDSRRAALELSKGDRRRRQFYGDRAIAALRHAVHAGRFNAETLETDTDLDPLRDRSDFQDLIKELEKKSAAGSR
jgi:non-specific serine/threonine protein kinase/serine/threonine-protein kinase